MNIWLQSSVFAPTPAHATAALEYLVAKLGENLSGLGHHVTLFALQGSDVPRVELVTVPRYTTPSATETAIVDRMERLPRPDVLFDHSRWQQAQTRWPALPAVTMIHGNASLEAHARNLVFCSVAHGRWHGRPNPVALHNGIEPADFRVGPPMAQRRGALWMGRIMPYKRPHLAVDMCEQAGVALTIAGPAADAGYFQMSMRPRLKPEGWADYAGEVAGDERLRLLSESCCLLMTSEAQDPAPIVVIEAMASGTPVFAFDHGSLPEFVRFGVSGFLWKTVDEFVEALRLHQWQQIDPAVCRQHVEDHLSMATMARKAEALLAQAAEGATW